MVKCSFCGEDFDDIHVCEKCGRPFCEEHGSNDTDTCMECQEETAEAEAETTDVEVKIPGE